MERVQQRQISVADLERMRVWAKSQPQAPEGEWYKDFGSFKLCGSGEYAKTVLAKGMKAYGTEIE